MLRARGGVRGWEGGREGGGGETARARLSCFGHMALQLLLPGCLNMQAARRCNYCPPPPRAKARTARPVTPVTPFSHKREAGGGQT